MKMTIRRYSNTSNEKITAVLTVTTISRAILFRYREIGFLNSSTIGTCSGSTPYIFAL